MKDKILDMLEKISGTDEVREDKDINLFESGLLDSLGIIELLVEIEDKFGVKIEPTSIEREEIETPNKIINYILERHK